MLTRSAKISLGGRDSPAPANSQYAEEKCPTDNPSVAPDVLLFCPLCPPVDPLAALGLCPSHTFLSVRPRSVPRRTGCCAGRGSLPVSPCRALRVRKKMSGEKMPVKMIGDILTAQLPHMQPYIRFCSCQLNGAALIQQKTDEAPDFKDFVKVRSAG